MSRRTKQQLFLRLLLLGALSAVAIFVASSLNNDGATQVPEAWETGAVQRLMDTLYPTDLPTFAEPALSDPVFEIEAAVLIQATSTKEFDPAVPTLLGRSKDPTEALDVAHAWSYLGKQPTDADLAAIKELIESTPPNTEYNWLLVEQIVGPKMIGSAEFAGPKPSCPTDVRNIESLYAAGVTATRVALRHESCERVELQNVASSSTDELSPELIEHSRAMIALAAVGAVPSEEGEVARANLRKAVAVLLATQDRTRPALDLLFQAYTVTPTISDLLQQHAESIIGPAERSMRWLGALPDEISGVNTIGSAQAARALVILESANADALWFVRHEVFEPYIDSALSPEVEFPEGEYRLVVAMSLGLADNQHFADRLGIDISRRLDSATALALTTIGPCLSNAQMQQQYDIAPALPFYYREGILRYAHRCHATVSTTSNPEISAERPSLYDQAALACTRDNQVPKTLKAAAANSIRANTTKWPTPSEQLESGTSTSIEMIYETAALIRVSQGKCDGFWWLESGS